MDHRTANITREELDREAEVVWGGGGEYHFCDATYVAGGKCERVEGHPGEHAVTGNTGRRIGWDA